MRAGLTDLEDIAMTRPVFLRATIVVGLLAILVSACAPDVADLDAACDDAYAQAMAIDPASDTVDAVDGAIASCSSLGAWVAAANRYPDTTAGQDPVAYAATRCSASPEIAATPVCVGLPSETTP
jgi:hypothetical protein